MRSRAATEQERQARSLPFLMMDERTSTEVCYRHTDRPTGLHCSRCGNPICVECSNDASVGQLCPDCAAPEGRHRVVAARSFWARPTFQTAPASFAIIAVTVGVYVLGMLSPELDRWLFENLALISPAVAAGEWWRIFSVTLLHGGLMHLAFNMYALYLFGPRLEQQVGSPSFLALYLGSAAVGSTVSYLFGPPNLVAVGASGAIFGLFGAWLFAFWKLRGSNRGANVMFNQLLVLLVINMLLPFLPGLNIDWRAHLGGLLAGILIAFLWSVFAAGRDHAVVIRTIIGSLVAVAAMIITVLA